ncbi:hypothetical protein AGOR_G00076160 [Albula goreensis]|uniref:G-protein coupled receptors family 1 profile domain-containing protein n=1 Tax=Albula goreensis TaxID=1534307 RepID=A0A8T3DTS0_9TELE|nr:hypothetical protein AGOR_G00076160 [Albula goreensis]
MALDRYFAICFPLKYSSMCCTQWPWLIGLLTWGLALVTPLSLLPRLKGVGHLERETCGREQLRKVHRSDHLWAAQRGASGATVPSLSMLVLPREELSGVDCPSHGASLPSSDKGESNDFPKTHVNRAAEDICVNGQERAHC